MTNSTDDVRNLSTQALDALREVANIGAGHAATALSQITSQRIMISVPHITVAAIEEPEAALPAKLDVLAVEDNPVNRLVLEQILGSLSVGFRIAATGTEGLADHIEHAPRLVLTDTTLPDMTAADFARGIRQIDPSALLVAIIPADTEDVRRQVQLAGYDHCLAKPLSAEALDELIPELLAQRKEALAGQIMTAR